MQNITSIQTPPPPRQSLLSPDLTVEEMRLGLSLANAMWLAVHSTIQLPKASK